MPPADHVPFLRAIIDRPDDDLPRLVFADWLDEHGDGERAEFIRLQVAGRGHRRAARLLADNASAWWPWLGRIDWNVPPIDGRAIWRVTDADIERANIWRGFPSRWSGEADAWFSLSRRILAEAPIREVHWIDWPSLIQAEAAASWPNNIQLRLNFCGLDFVQEFPRLWPGVRLTADVAVMLHAVNQPRRVRP